MPTSACMINFVSYRQTPGTPPVLYSASITNEQRDQEIIKVKDRFELRNNGENSGIDKTTNTATENAILACDAFFGARNRALLDTFRTYHFTIDFTVVDKEEDTYVEGKSMGFALTLGFLLSFFDIPIKQDIVTSGQIAKSDSALIVRGVDKIPQKAEILRLGEYANRVKSLIIPNISNQLDYQKDYGEIRKLSDDLSRNDKNIILCDTVIESVKYVITLDNFKALVGKLGKVKLPTLYDELFPKDAVNHTDTHIIGKKDKVLLSWLTNWYCINNHWELFDSSTSYTPDTKYKGGWRRICLFVLLILISLCFLGPLFLSVFGLQFHVTKIDEIEAFLPTSTIERQYFLDNYYSMSISDVRIHDMTLFMDVSCEFLYESEFRDDKIKNGTLKEMYFKQVQPVPLRLFFIIYPSNRVFLFSRRVSWDDELKRSGPFTTHIKQTFQVTEHQYHGLDVRNIYFRFPNKSDAKVGIIATFDLPDIVKRFESLIFEMNGYFRPDDDLYKHLLKDIPIVMSSGWEVNVCSHERGCVPLD